MTIAMGDMPRMPQRDLNVFYVLDTSGSMRGLPIATLNRAMGESLLALDQVASNHGNATIKVAVLEFNSTCRWMQPAGPEEMDDFVWQDLHAGGLTFMGAALRELNSKLSRDAFLHTSSGLFLPVIIFMTDGYANDDYHAALEEALRNEFFSEAVRIGFAVGESADVSMIAELTGDEKAVLSTTDLDLFADLLVFVTESASTMSVVPGETRQSSIGAAAVERAQRRAAGTSYSSWSMGGTGEPSATPQAAHVWDEVDW